MESLSDRRGRDLDSARRGHLHRTLPLPVQRCADAAALGAVEETIQSNVPSMGYTITYAIGNTLLIIWGVVIVLLIA